MSLTNPTKTEKAIAWLKTPGKLKLVGIVIGLIVVIGFVLFVADRCGDWSTNRDIEKRKANIAAGLANIANKEGVIANLQTEIAVEKAAVNAAVIEHLEDVGATDAAKKETNAALANLANAKNANTANSSISDLERALERLR